jgi:predicted nucleotidyltransferase
MTLTVPKELSAAVSEDSSVLFGYLFGSRAAGTANSRSDWDIAVYLNDELPEGNPVWHKFRIEDALARALGTDAVEVVLLNRLDDPVLSFEIISKGILLRDGEPDARASFESRALGRYQDWQYVLNRRRRNASAV